MAEHGTDERSHRVVVGACGDDASSRLVARALLMSGCEVVFVGGGQTIEHLARTVQAEDAGAIVIDADLEARAALEEALAMLGLDHVRVTACDAPDPPSRTRSG